MQYLTLCKVSIRPCCRPGFSLKTKQGSNTLRWWWVSWRIILQFYCWRRQTGKKLKLKTNFLQVVALVLIPIVFCRPNPQVIDHPFSCWNVDWPLFIFGCPPFHSPWATLIHITQAFNHWPDVLVLSLDLDPCCHNRIIFIYSIGFSDNILSRIPRLWS